jgi:molybdenum cofactor cytidylyltransferase
MVLAAGRSTRMGENKLLFRLEGESLVRRVVRAAVEGGLDPVLVVLGHEEDRIRAEIADLACVPIPNTRHALGMNTSLDAAVAAVPADADGAMVILADMPLVTGAMIREVVERGRRSGAAIVSARYGSVTAPPTLYARAVFPELRGGEGEGRGREVVRRRAGEVQLVDFPGSALADVDAPGDLERAARRGGPA